MLISEIFKSIQGEGPNVGVPSVFVRTQGCPVQCAMCDTPYTFDGSEKGDNWKVKEVLDKINIFESIKHIVLTGGEPLIQKDVEEFLQTVLDKGYSVEVETAGVTEPCSVYGVQYNLSPKLSCAQPKIDPDPLLLARWFKQQSHHGSRTYLKFVVADQDDWKEAKHLVLDIENKLGDNSYRLRDCIYFMPEGKTETEIKQHSLFLVDKIMNEMPTARLTPRLHINIWGSKRGV